MGEMFPFVVGSARSGTTLIREMLDTHSQLAVPPESHFLVPIARRRERYETAAGVDVDALVEDLKSQERFRRFKVKPDDLRASLRADPPGSLPDALRRLYRLHAAMKGKARYSDKTPHYIMHIKLLDGLFPDAKWLHVVRDGRNSALSIMEWPLGPNTLDEAVLMWRRRVEAGLKAAEWLGPRYLHYRHEDLVDDSEKVLRQICDFFDLQFEERMLRYYEVNPVSADFIKKYPHQRAVALPPTKGLRDFRTAMTPDQIEMTERMTGDLLTRLGYERATDVDVMDEEQLDAMQKAAVASRKAGRDRRLEDRRAELAEAIRSAPAGEKAKGLLRKAKRLLK